MSLKKRVKTSEIIDRYFGVLDDGSAKVAMETMEYCRKVESEKPKQTRRSFGMAKGELHYPDDIDFCNDEIAEMFGGWTLLGGKDRMTKDCI